MLPMMPSFDRFRPPDDPTDLDIKLNNLYYKRLDILEEIRKLENKLDDAAPKEAEEIEEEITYLKGEAWELEREMDTVRYWA